MGTAPQFPVRFTIFRSWIRAVLITVLAHIVCLCVARAEGTVPEISILDTALSLTRNYRTDIRMPQPWELGYVTAGRFPAINDILLNPFYLPPFAHVYGAHLNGSRSSITPNTIFMRILEMTGGSRDDQDPPRNHQRSLIDVFEDMRIRNQRGFFSPENRKYLEEKIQALPEGLEEPIAILCDALLEATILRKEALSRLTDKEITSITDDLLKLFIEPEDRGMMKLPQSPDAIQIETIKTIQKVNLPKLFLGMELLTEAIEITRPKLQSVLQDIRPDKNDEILLEYNSPIGPIVIGGPGMNRYDRDIALLVDLDGSDVYYNNAGGCLPISSGVACLIDMGGNDFYHDTRNGVQGSGILGIGLLIDYLGSDTYISGSWSQGAAYSGAGMLYDEKGSDHYRGDVLIQGAAAFGIGTMIDIEGDDVLICDSMGQGFGSTLGAGILVNGSGTDSYTAGRSDCTSYSIYSGFAQGSGIGFRSLDPNPSTSYWGGIGFLVDAQGNDSYFSPTHSQGAAYFLSMGILLDNQGNDLYDSRSLSQGSGSYLSGGVLIDQSGNDIYNTHSSAQGFARYAAVGMLLDYSGDDHYIVTDGYGQGSAQNKNSLALQIDYDGDDRYVGGFFLRGNAPPEWDPDQWCIGIMIDHRGQDMYITDGQISSDHKNNTTWHPFNGAVGIDTLLPPALYFINQSANSRIQQYNMSSVSPLEDNRSNSRLGSGDPFARFNALSRIDSMGSDALPIIVKAMQRGHSEFRRVLQEGTDLILLQSQHRDADMTQLLPLVHSVDPETRWWVLMLFEKYGFRSAAHDIRSLLDDTEADIRRAAIRILATFGDTQKLEQLKSMVTQDQDARCRRAALEAIAILDADHFLPLCRSALRDPDFDVQFKAIQYIIEWKDRTSAKILQELVQNTDVKIRIASAKALVQLGEKGGIPVLIDLLDNIPLEYHIHPNESSLSFFLAEYTGAEFGFDQESWNQWWVDAGPSLDMKKIAQARVTFLSIMKSSTTVSASTLVTQLKQARNTFPYYHGIDSRLAEVVHHRADGLLEQNTTDPKTALELALIAASMNPSTDYRASLAKAYFANGLSEKAIAEINGCIDEEPQNYDYRRLRDMFRGPRKQSMK